MKKPLANCKKGVNKFMKAWKELDYEKMFEATQITWKKENSIEKLKNCVLGKIEGYKTVKLEKMAECRYRVTVELTVEGLTNRITLHATSETAPYKASLEGDFGVNPESFRRG